MKNAEKVKNNASEGMINLEFSSLVLMEREKDTNFFVRELGSYEVDDGANYITKMYYDGEKINLYFDTDRDVEEWEYTAIFDLFNEEAFTGKGYSINEEDDEYNPTWVLKFSYDEEHSIVQGKLKEICLIIQEEMLKVFEMIKDNKEKY